LAFEFTRESLPALSSEFRFMFPGECHFMLIRAAMSGILNRPLVFGTVPSVILNRDHVSSFLQFLSSRKVYFEAMRFQQNFHLVRFPSLTSESVEDLLDQLTRRSD
jgi:hypothetical protein